MNQEPIVPKNPAEALITKPIRASVTAIALALMLGLTLNSVVTGVYAVKDDYMATIIEQESQLAAIASARTKVTRAAAKVEVATPLETNRIIVKYKTGKTAQGTTAAADRSTLEKAQGLRKVIGLKKLNAEVYEVSEADSAQEVVRRLLDTRKDIIEYAEVDMLVPPSYIPNDTNLGSAWHINKVQAPASWDLVQGSEIIIGIADTGVDCTHSDLAANCVQGWNVASDNNNTTDVNGHGTAVAGTAAAVGDNAAGAAGIAYKAKIMPLRVTDQADGWAYFSSIASAVYYAADNGARIVNASYNVCGASYVLDDAASYLRSKGGVVVLAGGNSGINEGFLPSNLITCVSATNSGDSRPSWSSFGQHIDVAAPGDSIYTTNRGGGYGSVSGTSFSSPLTAGVYALIFSANPALTPLEADSILFSSADDLGEAGWDQYYGYGRVNAARSVTLAAATASTSDSIPPSIPTNLRTTDITQSTAVLTWNPSTDVGSGLAGYSIYRNGTKLATVSGISYNDSNLSPRTSYSYTVRAEDVAGNISNESVPLVMTTPDIALSIASFSVVGKATATATISVTLNKPGTVTVMYGVSTSSLDLKSYSTSTSATHRVNLTNLKNFTTYYYQIVATDGVGTVTSTVSSFKTRIARGVIKPWSGN